MQWSIETVGNYVKLKNRASGLYVDGMGRTANGSDLGQWSSSNSNLKSGMYVVEVQGKNRLKSFRVIKMN